jgi:hypothetical protein
MSWFAATWLAWLTVAHAADFTEVQAGVQYDPGTRVGMTALGLSFELPDGWIGGLPPGGEAFVLGSNTQPGMVLITGDTGMTVDTARQFFSQPLPLDATTVAQPSGTPAVSGTTVTQHYTVAAPQGTLSGFGAGTVSERGSGLAIIAFGPDADAAEALSRRILGTVKAHAPPKAGDAPTGALADALKGQQLLYMKTENGFSDEEHVYLCSNGQAAIRSESSGMSVGGAGTATYAGQGGSDGTWTLNGNQVVVVLGDGSSRTWPVTLRGDGGVDIGRDNWWVQPQDACR